MTETSIEIGGETAREGLPSLTRNSSYRIAGFATGILLTLVTTPLFLRGFGLEGFGVWSIAIATLGLTGLMDLGIPVATVHLIAASRAEGDYARSREVGQVGLIALVLLGTGSAVAIWLLAPWVVSHVARSAIDNYTLLAVLRIVAMGAVPAFLVTWATNVFAGLERYAASMSLRLVPAVLGVGGASIGAIAGWSISAAMRWNVAVLALSSVIALVFGMRALGRGPEWAGLPARGTLKEMSVYSGIASVGGAAARAFNLIDRLLVGILLSASSAGVYTAAIGVANKLNSMSQNASQVLLPRVSSLVVRGRVDRVGRIFLVGHRFLASGTLVVGITISWFAYPLLAAWLGPEVAGRAEAPLSVLLFVYALVGSAVPSMHVLNGMGKPWVYSLLMAIAAGVSLSLMLVVGPHGVTWAAAANCGALVLLGLPAIASRFLGIDLVELMRWFGAPLLVGLAGFAGVHLHLAALTLTSVLALLLLAWRGFLMIREFDRPASESSGWRVAS